MFISHFLLAILALGLPIGECTCAPPNIDSPSQASTVLSTYDLVFVGSVVSRKFVTIEPEYFGQNVRKLLLTFDVSMRIKGVEADRVTALAPVSAACERFPKSIDFLVFASLVNEIYRIQYCSGAKRIGAETDAEVGFLIEAGAREN